MSRFDHRPRPLSRGLTLAALAAILAVTAMALSQCRQIDSLTGTGTDVKVLNPTLNAVSDCMHACNATFNTDHSAEVRLHDATLQGCGSDSDCIHAENTRHHNRQLEIVRAMQACKRNCHSTGPGAAGN